MTTLAGSVDSLYRTDEEQAFLAQKPTSIGSSEKKVMRVFLNASQFKTVGIPSGAFVYEVMQETRKKMRGEDTEEWGLYETKDGHEVRLLRESEVMDDITAFWTKGHQCLFKVRNPGDDPKEDLAKIPVRDGGGVFRGGGMMMGGPAGGLANAMRDALASRGAGGSRGGIVRGRGAGPPAAAASGPPPSAGSPGLRGRGSGIGGPAATPAVTPSSPTPAPIAEGPPPSVVRRPPPVGRGMVSARGSNVSTSVSPSVSPSRSPPIVLEDAPPPSVVPRPSSHDPRQSLDSTPPARPQRPPSLMVDSPLVQTAPSDNQSRLRLSDCLPPTSSPLANPQSSPLSSPHHPSPFSSHSPLHRSTSVAVVDNPRLSLLGRSMPSTSPPAAAAIPAPAAVVEPPKDRVKSVVRIYTDATTFKTIPSFEDATVLETISAVSKKMGGADVTNWALYLNCNSSDIRLLRESEVLATAMKGFSDSKAVFKARKPGDPGPEAPKPAGVAAPAASPAQPADPEPPASTGLFSPTPSGFSPARLPTGVRPTSMMVSRSSSVQVISHHGRDDLSRAPASPVFAQRPSFGSHTQSETNLLGRTPSSDNVSGAALATPPSLLRPKPAIIPVSNTTSSPAAASKPQARLAPPLKATPIEQPIPEPEPVAPIVVAPKPVFQKPVLQPKPSAGEIDRGTAAISPTMISETPSEPIVKPAIVIPPKPVLTSPGSRT
ncbi:MAG: hypothetical protein Q8P67_09650, partial [archaeon]|nr:hypothetical protein [archaeon]